MTSSPLHRLNAIRTAQNNDMLTDCLLQFALNFGLTHIQFVPGPDFPGDDPAALLACGNFSPDWQKRYMRPKEAINDPAWRAALSHGGDHVIHWRAAQASITAAPSRQFVQEARQQGYKDGITAALYGQQGCVALLIMAGPDLIDPTIEDIETIHLIATAAFQRLRRILAAALVHTPKVALTARECEVLTWVLEGKTNWEIGVLTGISARTIQFHLANGQKKLSAQNRTQAAMRALVAGLISPIKPLPNQNTNIWPPKLSEEKRQNSVMGQ